ncbi:MAG: pyruvate kinase [Chitinivibrionales bacterium]|nr:pyruvate kinase [Chitinivibrionales bacterium]
MSKSAKHCARKTRIVATLGPASSSPDTIEKLLRAGVNVFRLNFSHGTHRDHGERITAIRKASARTGITCGILADLQGPKIRTGKTPKDEPILLRAGKQVRITTRKVECSAEIISVDYAHLVDEIKPGQFVLINDGAIRLQVQRIEKAEQSIVCRIVDGGAFSSRKGVNLPGVDLRIPAMTVKDRRDAAFALQHDIHFIALSFVRSAKDLEPVHRLVKRHRRNVKVIAKIEKPEAAERIDEILDACDGIMVARGDLGVETSLEDVPVIQKDLIAQANTRAKMVIVATQMLESMIHNALPTRAESTDVANAILDGTDAVMLSGETAVGGHAVGAVETMVRIACAVETSRYFSRHWVDLSVGQKYPPFTVCEAAATASADFGDTPVLVYTLSGDTALYLSKIRNQTPIYAFSPEPSVVGMLSLAWNVTAFELPLYSDGVALQRAAEKLLLERRLLRKGQYAIVISGTAGARGATNFMRIKRVGEE